MMYPVLRGNAEQFNCRPTYWNQLHSPPNLSPSDCQRYPKGADLICIFQCPRWRKLLIGSSEFTKVVQLPQHRKSWAKFTKNIDPSLSELCSLRPHEIIKLRPLKGAWGEQRKGSKGHSSKRIDENMIIRLNSSEGSNMLHAVNLLLFMKKRCSRCRRMQTTRTIDRLRVRHYVREREERAEDRGRAGETAETNTCVARTVASKLNWCKTYFKLLRCNFVFMKIIVIKVVDSFWKGSGEEKETNKH